MKSRESYKLMIQAYQMKDNALLDSTLVDDSVLPLKLSLLGRDSEVLQSLENIDLEKFNSEDRAFLLEAELFNRPYHQINEANAALAREIVSFYEFAFFANFNLAQYYYTKKEISLAINAYEKMLAITPGSEWIIAELVYLCVISKKRNELAKYKSLLKKWNNKIFASIGIMACYPKLISLLMIGLGLIAMLLPYSFFLFLPMLLYFIINYFHGKKMQNRLTYSLSRFLILFFGIFSIISLIILLIYQ